MDRLSSFLIRAGLAAAFFYAATSAFLMPEAWVGFLPLWLKEKLSANLLLPAFSLYEIILGLWLLAGVWLRLSAALAFLTFFAIIFYNLGSLDIVFRDIPLMLAALALFFAGARARGFV